MNRDSEARRVAAEAAAAMDRLASVVDALKAVLTPPAEPDAASGGKEAVPS